MENIFITNLKFFLKQQAITQTEFAKQMGVSNASVSNYLSGQNEPSLTFLQNFKKAYEISLDDFLIKKQENTQNVMLLDQNLLRFVGNYLLYFYDSSAYLGSTSNLEKNALKYGVISVIANKNKLTSYCGFFKEFENATSFKNKLDSAKTPSSLLNMLLSSDEIVYDGTVEISQTQIFIFLKSFNDQSLIIFNNPPSNKTYIGGLGTVNSVSRGREHMPSIQFALIARKELNLPEGEIYNMLALDTVDVNMQNQTEKLLTLFKNLYLTENQNTLKLEEFQKKKIFESSLQNIISDAIELNVFRFAKISARTDDEYYNLIKKGEQ
jgi:transcriptional regulator with XRE-family HTH domain